MQIVEQQPGLLVCHQSPTYTRAIGAVFAALGAATLFLIRHVHGSTRGSPIIGYVVGAGFVAAGVLLFASSEDDQIEIDGASRLVRITRRSVWRGSTTELPFALIRDVALEVTAPNTNLSARGSGSLTWRPVFVTTEGGNVPWTPISTSNRAPQALAVAAARAVGGWNALPIEGAPTIARAVTTVKNLGCLYIFAALFSGFLLWIMALQVMPLLTWKQTAATVVSSGITSVPTKNGQSWKPAVTYTYTVGGIQYTSYRVAPLEQSASERWARSVSGRYQRGAVVPAWYNPRRPSDAFVERRLSYIPLIMMGIMAGVVLLFVGVVKRTQSATQAALSGGDVPIVNRQP